MTIAISDYDVDELRRLTAYYRIAKLSLIVMSDYED